VIFGNRTFIKMTKLLVAFTATAALFSLANGLECSAGWKSLDGDCFLVSTDSIGHRSWMEAKTYCEDRGASLPQPTTYQQVRKLAGLLKGDGDRFGTFWVGAGTKGGHTYKWLNGAEVTAGWRKDLPKNMESWRCVAIQYQVWPGHDDSGLETWRCKNNGRFICQISDAPTTTPAPTTTTTTTTTTQAPVECPSDWVRTELGCFFISVDTLTWWEAKTWCAVRGSTLAVPQHKNKPAIRNLTNMLSKPGLSFGAFWVGGNNGGDGRNFSWTDDSEVDEGTWRKGQPKLNGSWRVWICLAVRYNQWTGYYDSGLEINRCKDDRRFICQKF